MECIAGLSDAQKEIIKDKIPSKEHVKQLGERVKRFGVKKVELIVYSIWTNLN